MQTAFRIFPSVPRQLTFEGGDIRPTRQLVPTRHGPVACHIYRPRQCADPQWVPPVYVNFHGGAFIVGQPRQDEHVCRYLAAAAGIVVVNVDYGTAPMVQYPVAEQQAMDVSRWVRQHAQEFGWDGEAMVVGGFSAGGKLAVNVCQQMRDACEPMPSGLVACYPALNMTLAPDDSARSLSGLAEGSTASPAVAPWLIQLMYDSYFANAERRREPLASPELDTDLARFPATLILTCGRDVMSAEAERFAASLALHGVDVRCRQFTDSDHGMTHNLPVEIARESLELIAEHVIQTCPPKFPDPQRITTATLSN